MADRVFAEIEWSDDPDPAIDVRIAEEAIRTGDTMAWPDVRSWVQSWGKLGELRPRKWPQLNATRSN